MYHFTDDFIRGLETKSEGFQAYFYQTVDSICDYLSEEDAFSFQKYLEANVTYKHPGNILSCEASYGASEIKETREETVASICTDLMKTISMAQLFDDDDDEDPWMAASHIVLVINMPSKYFDNADTETVSGAITASYLIPFGSTNEAEKPKHYKNSLVYHIDNEECPYRIFYAFFR